MKNEESSLIYKPLSNATQFNEFCDSQRTRFCAYSKRMCVMQSLIICLVSYGNDNFYDATKTIFFLNYFVTDTMSCLFSVILEVLVRISHIPILLVQYFFNDLKMISTIFFRVCKTNIQATGKCSDPFIKYSSIFSAVPCEDIVCFRITHVQKVDRERKMTIGSSRRQKPLANNRHFYVIFRWDGCGIDMKMMEGENFKI